MKMSHFYYGAWQNFYHLSWPVRFFVELLVTYWVIKFVFRLIKMIVCKLQLDTVLIKGLVWLVTELVYLIGRNRNWAIEIDNKMIAWGEKAADRTAARKHSVWKKRVFFIVVIVYFAAIFVDLPFANRLEAYYLTGFMKVKAFCQSYEKILSGNYDQYPPLFIKKDMKPKESEIAEDDQQNGKEPVYIRLNEQGGNGSNIRKDPSMSGAVVGGADKDSVILYQQQFENDGERYWIKVYLPAEEVEGWLSGNLIESEQLERIVIENY